MSPMSEPIYPYIPYIVLAEIHVRASSSDEATTMIERALAGYADLTSAVAAANRSSTGPASRRALRNWLHRKLFDHKEQEEEQG